MNCIANGIRVIQERDVSNTPTVSYTRGSDLSGSLEGAGGIGGLLARSHAYQSGSGSFTNHNFYHCDGGGNITYMVNSSQSMVASYRYDPFGNTISSSGTLASANVYRFSSKERHANSGMYYYGYRFYDPNLQRWLNRDPLGDIGFQKLNLSLENMGEATVTQSVDQLMPLLRRIAVLLQADFRKLRRLPKQTASHFAIITETRSGEGNLYCFVGNKPINLIDPDGLTGWGFQDPFGRPLPMPPYPSPNCDVGASCRIGCATAATIGATLTCPETGPGVGICAGFWAFMGAACAELCPK